MWLRILLGAALVTGAAEAKVTIRARPRPQADALATAENWFARKAETFIVQARRKLPDGTVVFAPQTSDHYNATWLGDFVFMLEAGVIPAAEAAPAARVFLDGLSPEGCGVNCVKYDGTPVYQPGYGTMGTNPISDGSQYTVSAVYFAWRQTRDATLLATNVLDRLVQAMAAIPHDPDGTGLVWIDPSKEWDRSAFGFTDTVRKQGNCLYESLLEIQAGRQLAEMLSAAGRDAEARALACRMIRACVAVNATFWDAETGLYRAATVKCREHDVWGSAFAVWLGVAPDDRADAVGLYFRDHYAELVQRGQVRHCASGEYWEQACERDTYQNGGFWGTPVGWFAYALERVAPELVERQFTELVADYRARGVSEWTFGATVQIPEGFLGSVMGPLAGLRRIRAERTGGRTLETIRNWFETKACDITPKARRAMTDGSGAWGYVPQTGSNYDAVWLRDYFYTLEAGVVPAVDLVPASMIFVNAISPEGWGVDCVRYNGTPIYKPGYGSMGENAVADGSQFTVNVAYEAWRQSGDARFIASNVLDRLVRTMAAIPHDPDGKGLVWIDPAKDWDRCPYGFTDSIRKQGCCLFESLLEIQAGRYLAQMLAAAGRTTEATSFRARAAAEAAQVNSVFWDAETGLYRAATVACREHDVWGSAFAVWLGVADDAQAEAVGRYFRDHGDGLVWNGQVRHCTPGVYWERGCARDTYQNGGFWGTPVGWFAYALERVAPEKVDRLYNDLFAYYRKQGVCEWCFQQTVAIPDGYLASAAQPLVGLWRILAARMSNGKCKMENVK